MLVIDTGPLSFLFLVVANSLLSTSAVTISLED